jgi:pimeloyl-ACP methyl ester carboxylesterase
LAAELPHEQEIAAQKIAISEFNSRSEIDDAMERILPDKTLRQFIQMNIGRDVTGQYVWINNIRAIEGSKSRTAFPAYANPLYTGPTLAIRGLKSSYITDADVDLMRRAFPRLEMHDIEGAEHWLHYSHPDQVLKIIRPFLRSV